jgi:hypothetical protein
MNRMVFTVTTVRKTSSSQDRNPRMPGPLRASFTGWSFHPEAFVLFLVYLELLRICSIRRRPNQRILKIDEGADVQLHTFLTFTLNGSIKLQAAVASLLPGKELPGPVDRRLGKHAASLLATAGNQNHNFLVI